MSVMRMRMRRRHRRCRYRRRRVALPVRGLLGRGVGAVQDAAQPGVIQTAERLASQGADVFLTGATATGATTLPAVTGLHPLVAPLVQAVAFYAFVETLARRGGFDPDAPPHLRKVTETI